MSDKPTYEDLENQIAQLKRQNDSMQLHSKKRIFKDLQIHEEIFSRTNLGILVFHENGECIKANQAICHIIGAPSPEAVLTHNFHEIQSWKKTGLYQKVLDALQFNQDELFETDLITTYGKSAYIAFHCSSFTIEGDKYLMVISEEITERKKTELQLIESEEKFSKIFHLSPLMMAISDVESGEFLDVNQAHLDVSGYKRNELIGKKSVEIDWISQDDRNRLSEIMKTNGYVHNQEVTLWTKENNPIHALYSGFIIDINENRQIVSVAYDISERKLVEEELKESEEKYRFITENINDIIWKMDLQTNKFTYVSPSILSNTGYTVEEFTSKNLNDILVPIASELANQKIVERINRLLNSDFSAKTSIGEYQMINKDGTIVWVETSNSLLLDGSGLPLELIGVTRNIEIRKEIEIKLQNFANELNQLNTDKDRFMSILAHDLKGPFNLLIGFSELLLKNLHKFDIDKIEKQVQIIHQTTINAYHLLDDLLLWSKSQSGKLNLEPQKIVFGEICNEIVDSLKHQADLKGISIHCFEALHTMLFADLNMVKTIFRNLISNAIKFTNTNGEINIYTEIDNSKVIITITDNGVGISAENQTKLWDFTKHFTTNGTNEEKGTGFGLLLCKEFVEKHGEEIWVESEPGKGSSFKFTLPRYQVSE